MDYRTKISDQLNKLINDYTTELGNDQKEEGVVLDITDPNSWPESESPCLWSSQHFAEHIKQIALEFNDYEMVGRCTVLLELIDKSEDHEYDHFSDFDSPERSQRQPEEHIAELTTFLENKHSLAPSHIGMYFGMSYQNVNKSLIDAGFMQKTHDGLEATELGEPHLFLIHLTSSGRKACRWKKSIVEELGLYLGKTPQVQLV